MTQPNRTPNTSATNTPSHPTGFAVQPAFLLESEHDELLAYFDSLEFPPSPVRGRFLRRQIVAYGKRFSANFLGLEAAPPLPKELHELRKKAAEWSGVEPMAFTQALLQRFPVGAGISWHRDASRFSSPIVGISFGAVATLRLREAPRSAEHHVLLEPRSIYSLDLDARWQWQHSIKQVRALRYSVTFRVVAPLAPCARTRHLQT